MTEPDQQKRARLLALLDEALALADELGDLALGCRLSAARDTLLERKWTLAEIEAMFDLDGSLDASEPGPDGQQG